MVKKTVKTLNGKLSISLPSTIDEVTLRQVMQMQEKPTLNDLEAISILSGTPLPDIQNIKNFEDLHVFGEVILLLSQQVENLYANDQIPKKITFNLAAGSKTISVIKNLSVEPAGAFFAAREIIAGELNAHIKTHGDTGWPATFNPSLNACCQVLAHYFYCRATGKIYHEYEAEEFISEIKKLRVMEALPIAIHFFHIKNLVVTILGTASIVASVMTTYFGLRDDIRDIRISQQTENRINNMRIKVLEDEMVVLQRQVDEIRFSKVSQPGYRPPVKLNYPVLLTAAKTAACR